MCQPDPLLRIKTRSSLAAFPTIPTFPFSFPLSYTARVVPRASTGSISSAARVSTEFCGTASETDASARRPTLICSDATKCPLVEPSDRGLTLMKCLALQVPQRTRRPEMQDHCNPPSYPLLWNAVNAHRPCRSHNQKPRNRYRQLSTLFEEVSKHRENTEKSHNSPDLASKVGVYVSMNVVPLK